MKKGRELKNLPVIDVNSGRQLGCIREFELEDNRKIAGIYINSGRDECYYIPLGLISSIGRDAVLVTGWIPASQEELEELKDKTKTRYTGAQVLTSLGQSIGTIEDIVIEESEGSIMGYEVSDGLFKDMALGRKVIAAADILTYGDETIIVADSN